MAMLLATASKEDQMSNCVSRSLFISTELPLVSKLLTSANGSCFSWSKQSRHVQVQVLVTDCRRPRRRTADKAPRCPLIESVYIHPFPSNKLGETRLSFYPGRLRHGINMTSNQRISLTIEGNQKLINDGHRPLSCLFCFRIRAVSLFFLVHSSKLARQ